KKSRAAGGGGRRAAPPRKGGRGGGGKSAPGAGRGAVEEQGRGAPPPQSSQTPPPVAPAVGTADLPHVPLIHADLHNEGVHAGRGQRVSICRPMEAQGSLIRQRKSKPQTVWAEAVLAARDRNSP